DRMSTPAVAIVVEDEPQIRRFVRTALESESWRVFEAGTLKDGLSEAATRRPELVVLDLALPDGDGIELVRSMRAWSSSPIRVLTLLATNAGRVLTHRQILREVWGPSHVEHEHYTRIYMGHLRRKLEADPAQPRFLLTETAVGYRLVTG